MEASLYVPLREMETLKELFQAMEENGLTKEKKQVMDLADYIDRLDSQLGDVLDEIRDLKEQLDGIQGDEIKNKVLKIVGKAEGKIQEVKSRLQHLKDKFATDIRNTVDDFKTKGVSALYKAVDFLGLERGMRRVKTQMNQGILVLDRGIDQLATIGDEVHAAKAHLGNVGKALTGKDVGKPKKREVEKGAVFQTQKALYCANYLMKSADGQADRLLQKLESLAEQAGNLDRPSVRGTLKSIEKGKNGCPEMKKSIRTVKRDVSMADGKKKVKVR